MRFQRQRGTQDILPEQARHWQALDANLRRTLALFDYGEIRTPLFEDTQLFVRGVGSDTDIVQKEMYTFVDRKGRSLSLRPEGTAAVVRAYLDNQMGHEGGVRRLFYIGPMYRYDRPQAGRFREFFQLGAEAIGSAEPEQDVEIIDLMMTALARLPLPGLEVEVNSVGHPACRAAYETRLRQVLAREGAALCRTCQERIDTNPMRVFDCKNEACRPVVQRLPRIRAHLCDACNAHHDVVLTGLQQLGIPHRENTAIVRGLDYYTRTAFEVHYPPLGAQSALGGGGRYDGLVEACGGPKTPGVGFSAGLERILFALEKTQAPSAAVADARIVVLPLDRPGRLQALQLAHALRDVAPTGVDLSGRSLKSQLRGAGRSGARVAVILGAEDRAPGEVVVRDLAASVQTVEERQHVVAAVRALLQGQGG